MHHILANLAALITAGDPTIVSRYSNTISHSALLSLITKGP
jgi:hypothetical protein